MTEEVVMFVIRYDGSRESYFAGWVEGASLVLSGGGGRTTGLPRFGATLEQAARYATRAEAEAQVYAMPLMASVCCDVVEIAEVRS